MNDIQIDLQDLPADVRKWVKQEIKISNMHDVGVRLLRKRHVLIDSVRCAGYFCDATPELVVACYKKLDDWLPVMVHETCHRDQATQNTRIWTRTVDGHDPLTMLHQWLDDTIDLPPDQLRKVVDAVLQIELDCEKRAARKIKKHKLPIDVTEYIQRANGYVYFYLSLEITRKWYAKNRAPFHLDHVWQAMPTHFENDYTTIPPKLKKLILNECFD